MTRQEKAEKAKRLLALYNFPLKDQNPDDLPEWGTPYVPATDTEKEGDDYYVVGELNFD